MFVDITDISRFQESRRPWVASEIFDERLRFMQKADKLGYTNFWFAEHHFHDNHPLSVPNLMLAAASQLTERLRLGLMVNVLPFHHPLRVAEESTILDHLSHGRFDLGVGRGIQKLEYDGWDIPMEESWPRFQECLDVIMRLLRDEKVTHHGQYYNLENASVEPKPLQQPHPPVYVASISPPSLRLAAENNFGFVAAFKPLQEERETMGLYRTVWSEHHSGEMPVCGTMKIAYVAESDAKAREDVQEMLTQNLAAFARWGFPTPAQYAQVPALAQAYDRESYTHASKGIGDRTFDQMVEDGLILVGGPDTVIRKIQDIRSAGYGRVLLAMAFGEVPIAKAENSLELVGREVIPAVRSL